MSLTAEQLSRLADPLWRVNNLYSIITKREGIQPFKPFWYQNRLYEDIYKKGRRKHVIIKARRMGFSTAIDIQMLDLALFNRAIQCSIVDLTQEDAREKMRSKVRVGWQEFKKAGYANDLGVVPFHKGDGHWSFNTESHIYAGINARGGTNHFLHISEWGPIAHQDPERSKRILTGALPSADEGIVVIETTWMGGKAGELWGIVKDAMEIPAEEKTEQDFWFHFVPWFDDPRHRLEGQRELDEETDNYLRDLEQKQALELTHQQKQWYFVNRSRYRDDMGQEYPSTPEEAFERRVAGAIYGKWVSAARAQGRISDFPLDERAPVHISMDLGIADYLPLWFVQFVGKEIRLVDWYENNGEGIAHYARVIRRWEIEFDMIIGAVYLPHDGNAKQLATNQTIKETLEGLLPHIEIKLVDRTANVWQGIDWIRSNFNRFWIHKTNCGTPRNKDGIDYPSGLECLENYHQKLAEAGTTSNRSPVHDVYSHSADALRTLAEAIDQGIVDKIASPKSSPQNFIAPPVIQ